MDAETLWNEQFDWKPEIQNAKAFLRKERFIVCGMGGSHLGADMLLRNNPLLALLVHSDYGLPAAPPEALRLSRVIASSYSGDTEETLDAAQMALKEGLSVAAVSTGGKLLAFAQERRLPYIEIPKTDIQPRMAMGYQMLALASFMGDARLESDIRAAGKGVDIAACKENAEALAVKLRGSTPLIYASARNAALSYYFKISFNESAKVPSFANAVPELCHNELESFEAPEELYGSMRVVMLHDMDDHPRTMERMKTLAMLLREKGVIVEEVTLAGDSALEKIFGAIMLAHFTAAKLAEFSGIPEGVTPLIAEFKKQIGQ